MFEELAVLGFRRLLLLPHQFAEHLWMYASCPNSQELPRLRSRNCLAYALATADFAPTIVASLGFKGPMGQLLTVFPNVFAFFVIIFNSWHSDRTKERPLHILAGCALVMAGYLILAVVRHWGVRYMGVFFIACTNAAVIPLYVRPHLPVSALAWC